jgi:hypothetical protein
LPQESQESRRNGWEPGENRDAWPRTILPLDLAISVRGGAGALSAPANSAEDAKYRADVDRLPLVSQLARPPLLREPLLLEPLLLDPPLDPPVERLMPLPEPLPERLREYDESSPELPELLPKLLPERLRE